VHLVGHIFENFCIFTSKNTNFIVETEQDCPVCEGGGRSRRRPRPGVSPRSRFFEQRRVCFFIRIVRFSFERCRRSSSAWCSSSSFRAQIPSTFVTNASWIRRRPFSNNSERSCGRRHRHHHRWCDKSEWFSIASTIHFIFFLI